jgi:ABC-type sulfate/molybdate transport systems ATPase subunit
MDEPLVHVDPARAGTYWNVVRDHCRTTATSLVIATHSPEVVLREAEHVVCLSGGCVAFAGDVPTLYDRPPSRELARFLGPINWFTPDEATWWLGVTSAGDVSCRPERLSVVRDDASPLVIRSSRFAGSVAEIELSDDRGAPPMTIFHRPAIDDLRPGDRVTLRVSDVD